MNRMDNDISPKPACVLANAPAFNLAFAGASCLLQHARGKAGQSILLRIEDGEMAADDLIGGVALDSLSAGVPAGDIALGIEHENGVVGNRFDQKAEAAFAFTELFRAC